MLRYGPGTTKIWRLKARGVPVEFVSPKEGAIAFKTTVHVVKNSPNRELTVALIESAMSPKVQTRLTETRWGSLEQWAKMFDAFGFSVLGMAGNGARQTDDFARSSRSGDEHLCRVAGSPWRDPSDVIFVAAVDAVRFECQWLEWHLSRRGRSAFTGLRSRCNHRCGDGTDDYRAHPGPGYFRGNSRSFVVRGRFCRPCRCSAARHLAAAWNRTQ